MSAPSPSIFRWDTLREIGSHEFRYLSGRVPGRRVEVELTSGPTILAWRADDGIKYFCHGLTFGGKERRGGAISPYTGQSVEVILREHYTAIPEVQATAGDILVWRGVAPLSTPHSTLLIDPVIAPGTMFLADASRLRSKNGMRPETDASLKDLNDEYGESYNVYRRR